MTEQTRTFNIDGMTCAACVRAVEHAIEKSPNVSEVRVNLVENTATVVSHANTDVDIESEVSQLVKNAGYAVVEKQDQNHEHNTSIWKTPTGWALILTLPIVVLSMFVTHFPLRQELVGVLTAVVVFGFGREFFVNAWKQVKHGSANMDTLVALGTGTAFFASVAVMLFGEDTLVQGHNYFESAAVIVALVLLGRYLEHNARRRTSGAIQMLMGRLPNSASLVNEQGQVTQVRVDDIQVGDRILVKSGNVVPIDGIVESGSAWIDESMLTGESIPVEKTVGDKAVAGSACTNGTVHITVTGVGDETNIAKIAEFIRRAQSTKAPVQKLADTIASYFVPIVLVIALVTAALWYALGGQMGGQIALVTGIAVLVIACPCALGLATPTALIAGLGKAAEEGILIRDAEALEHLAAVKTIVFDKTGTLTVGKPNVVGVDNVREFTAFETAVIATIEQKIEHPIAECVHAHFAELQQSSSALKEVPEIELHVEHGSGVSSVVNSVQFRIGNLSLMEKYGIDTSVFEKTKKQSPHTLVFVAIDEEMVAVLEVGDELKETTTRAIHWIQEQGIEVQILSGDREPVVKHIAERLNIDIFHAQVVPEEKATVVQTIASKKRVAMVGDGINDAPALVSAHVGIAMGRGSDIAIESAGIIIPSSDLAKIAQAIVLGKRTKKVIHSNLAWAFAYNVAGIPLAAGVLYPFTGWLLNPMFAGAAMAFSSVSVVLNSLRLRGSISDRFSS